jgi:hypothetical protein
MYLFKKHIYARIFLIFMLIIQIFIVYLMFKLPEHRRKLIWAIPAIIYEAIVFSIVLQEKIIIEDDQIIQTAGSHSLFKPRVIKWEDIEYVVKCSWGIPVYRLLTNKAVKTKYINISGITDTDLLLEEIVKRAKNARIDSDIQMLLREKKNKSK